MKGFTPAPILIRHAPKGKLVRGFTLVEVLITVLILSFIIAGIFSVLNVADLSWHSDTGLLDLQQQARQAMHTMVKELRQGRAADIIILGPGDQISFYMPPAVYGEPWVGPISYYVDVNDANNDGVTDQVIREYPPGERRVLARNIVSLGFSLNADAVEIQLAAEKTVRMRQLCFPSPCQDPKLLLKETMRLRNE